ncbi:MULTISPECIES: sce7726 family protein [unclassified Beijerinckia]|uniref:sce7726 family protein n=1 Tax=unclassified Beijerinckia TaxID=2638183 RepID=UPI00089514A8|nr:MULTISPECIES: sce7726 family protein [unclassified Beijerinckia]MDH7795921.1 hypothetical protein [Beijerinckia sp. GAS462]SEC22311.1 hypothetical protein SAMN05443249_2200 [Beijerinckia sp. 28-YEA-48]
MHDGDVRRAVLAHLADIYGADPSTRVVEEMGVWSGTVRVDIAVVNGKLSGYELKSNSDTLERLPYQVEIYGKVFDHMTLVVGDKHAEKALRIIPKWWGCVMASMHDGKVKLKSKRKGRQNPQPDPSVVVQMLWKDEAVAVLEKHGLANGWRSKRAGEISARLLSEIPFRQLRDHVRDALKVRQRLGQLAPSQFDMPIDTEADPAPRASRGSSRVVSNGVDHVVSPAVSQRETVW